MSECVALVVSSFVAGLFLVVFLLSEVVAVFFVFVFSFRVLGSCLSCCLVVFAAAAAAAVPAASPTSYLAEGTRCACVGVLCASRGNRQRDFSRQAGTLAEEVSSTVAAAFVRDGGQRRLRR